MKTSRTVIVAMTAAFVLSLPVLAQTPTTTTEPAKATEPAKEPEKKPAAAPAAPAAGSPMQIKVGDATLRFGLLVQPQADFQQNTAGAYTQNLLLRRVRFLVGGQVSKEIFFFFETENSRLGNATATGAKTMNTGFQTLDAVVEYRPNKKFNVSGGLIRVPTSRDALESASNEFTLDFNSYAFMVSTALGSTGGRDTGVMARGWFFKDRLEYRGAVLAGMRENGNRNSFRKTGRLQWNFFDTEVYNFPSYAGSNFGKKKILALGAAVDSQMDYTGWTTDLFGDFPTSFGSALGTVSYHNVDGGRRSPNALATQQIYSIDGGLFFKNAKVGPWVRYEQRDFDVQTTRDEKRYIAGINYYPMGNNFNIKAGVARLIPVNAPETNQFTIQLQVYYY